MIRAKGTNSDLALECDKPIPREEGAACPGFQGSRGVVDKGFGCLAMPVQEERIRDPPGQNWTRWTF